MYTDSEIIDNLKKGGASFEKITSYLFKQYYGYLSKVKSKLHLPQEDIENAYADAIVKLIRHLKNGSFRGDSKISSYFYTIFYNTAVDVSRKNASHKNMKTQELKEYDAREADLLRLIDNKDEVRHINLLIQEMGDSCQKILIDWGYYGYSMEEIAQRAQLSNAESARSMKYKCLKKLRSLIQKANA